MPQTEIYGTQHRDEQWSCYSSERDESRSGVWGQSAPSSPPLQPGAEEELAFLPQVQPEEIPSPPTIRLSKQVALTLFQCREPEEVT